MKFTKSITFDLKAIDLILEYKKKHKTKNFSLAVNNMLFEGERFRKIAYKFQKIEE